MTGIACDCDGLTICRSALVDRQGNSCNCFKWSSQRDTLQEIKNTCCLHRQVSKRFFYVYDTFLWKVTPQTEKSHSKRVLKSPDMKVGAEKKVKTFFYQTPPQKCKFWTSRTVRIFIFIFCQVSFLHRISLYSPYTLLQSTSLHILHSQPFLTTGKPRTKL